MARLPTKVSTTNFQSLVDWGFNFQPVGAPIVRRGNLTAGGAPERELSSLLGSRQDPAPYDDDEVWRMYNGAAGGETRFFVTRVKNLAARVSIYPTILNRATGEWEPNEDSRFTELVSQLAPHGGNQNQLISQATALFALVGHCRLLGTPDAQGNWGFDALSTKELQRSGQDQYILTVSDRGVPRRLDATKDNIAVSWLWKRGLERSLNPDTSIRAALPILHLIEKLQLSLSAVAESRLTGSGLLLLAREIDRRAPKDGKPVFRFADELEQVMMTALTDQGVAAARVPITIELPHAMVQDGVKFLDLSKMGDKELLKWLDHGLVRLARAFSWPDEVLMPGGTKELNHWSAWWVGEREFGDFFSPLMTDVTDALAEGWYRRILRDNGVDPLGHGLGFDARAVRRKIEDVDKAVKLFEKKIINVRAAAEISGMDPDKDVPGIEPSEAERREEMIKFCNASLAYGAIFLPQLGYPITDEERQVLLGLNPDANPQKLRHAYGRRVVPGAGEPTGNEGSHVQPNEASPPDTLNASANFNNIITALAYIIDSGIWNAWRTAGNKIRNSPQGKNLRVGDSPLSSFKPEELGRLLGPNIVTGIADKDQLWDGCWELCFSQIESLVGDSGTAQRIIELAKHTAAQMFFQSVSGVRVIEPTIIQKELTKG